MKKGKTRHEKRWHVEIRMVWRWTWWNRTVLYSMDSFFFKMFFFFWTFQVLGQAGECLTGCHLVLVPAGVPRKPGQDVWNRWGYQPHSGLSSEIDTGDPSCWVSMGFWFCLKRMTGHHGKLVFNSVQVSLEGCILLNSHASILPPVQHDSTLHICKFKRSFCTNSRVHESQDRKDLLKTNAGIVSA